MDPASLPRMLAWSRIGYAGLALMKPRTATAILGGRPSDLTPIALGWASAFAPREAVLAAVSLATENADPATRRKILLMNAAVDVLDVLTFLTLAKRQRSLLPIILGAPGSVFSAYAHIQAAQQISVDPGAATAYEPAFASA